MQMKCALLAGVAAFAVAASAQAQNAAAAAPDAIETIVVTGVRQSLETAMEIKKNSDTVVDSIISEDIGKFPDMTVADSLQRITGIQITRDLGEGNGIAIRGLTQIQTTINGQEIFTAQGSRIFDMKDMPAELVSGVDVYKSATANILEGGLGGSVDIRTHRPFDFDGMQFTIGGKMEYGDIAKAARPQGSVMFSDRFTTGIGEFGALINLSFQQRAFGQSYVSAGTPKENTYASSDETIIAPYGVYNLNYKGHRERTGINGSFQWRPTSELDFYFDANVFRMTSYQNNHGYSSYASMSSSVEDSFTTFDGTEDFKSGSYSDVGVTTYGIARDNTNREQSYTLGGNWNHNNILVNATVNYLRAKGQLVYRELDLSATAPTMTQSLAASIPTAYYSGIDLTDISNYTTGYLTLSQNNYDAKQLASQANVAWIVDYGWLSEVDAGIRYSVHDHNFTPIRFYQSTGSAAAEDYADLFQVTNLGLFSGKSSGERLTQSIITAKSRVLRNNFGKIREAFGLGTDALTPTTLSIYNLSERTTSGFLMAKFGGEYIIPIDGNIGVRIVHTNTAMDGYRTDSDDTSNYLPIDSKTNYDTVLPSGNIRFHLTDDVVWRVAFAKTVTKPSFSNLTPGLTLVPASQSGSGGNPDLKPMYATNYDTSVEYYFAQGASVYLAGFYKNVKNFVFSSVSYETIDDIEYSITLPQNSKSGTVKGYEVGYTQFFDFLPGNWKGLGVQANYTYVDSNAPTSVEDYNTTLPSLSRHSFNIVGMYELDGLTARLAYNWRSKYYSSLSTSAAGGHGGVSPIYANGFGWLDASISYDVSEHVSFSIDASNLLNTKQSSYYVYKHRQSSATLNDREFMVGFRYKM